MNAILEAIKLGDEERVQVLTAEKIAKCIEMRTESHTICEVVQRHSHGVTSRREEDGRGWITEYPDHDGWLYDPAEVYCTSYNDQSSPQSLAATYIGPVCNSYDENGGLCDDSKYASMLAFDWVAARYAGRGKADQAGQFVRSFSGTFFDSFDWDSGNHASTAHPGDHQAFNNVTVLQTNSDLGSLLDDYSYVCDDAVEALDFPTPENLVASENYTTYLDGIDVLWDTFNPMDILTPPALQFINFEEGGARNIPLLLDEELSIDVRFSTSIEEGESVFETTGSTNPWDGPVESCRISVTATELKSDPSLVEDLIDCELLGGGSSVDSRSFNNPGRYWASYY